MQSNFTLSNPGGLNKKVDTVLSEPMWGVPGSSVPLRREYIHTFSPYLEVTKRMIACRASESRKAFVGILVEIALGIGFW